MTLHHSLRRSLLVAAAYLLSAVVLNELRQQHVVSAATTQRLMGMLMGLVVLFSANVIPKRLMPLARLSCDPSREQTLRRFAAWALVLGGLGFTLAYALAPIAIASTLAICLLAPSTLVVVGIRVRCVWVSRNARQSGA